VWSLGFEPQYRLDEIRPARAEHPRRWDDHVPRQNRSYRRFAGFLTAAIDIERADRIVLVFQSAALMMTVTWQPKLGELKRMSMATSKIDRAVTCRSLASTNRGSGKWSPRITAEKGSPSTNAGWMLLAQHEARGGDGTASSKLICPLGPGAFLPFRVYPSHKLA
jgi:hypothetical protein